MSFMTSHVWVSIRTKDDQHCRVFVHQSPLWFDPVLYERVCRFGFLPVVVREVVQWAREHAVEVFMDSDVLLLYGE